MSGLKKIIFIAGVLFFCLASVSEATVKERPMKEGEFLVLCYHAVVDKPKPGDNYTVSKKLFIDHMEYLRTHGYHPVSLRDLRLAMEGRKKLPEKPVLLTFDDGYVSYYEFVLPFLERLGYPSVLSVVGTFIGNEPEGIPEPIMNWDQLKKVASNPMAEVVSHTYDMHRGVVYNPQGNTAPAMRAFVYDPKKGTYETEAEYVKRIEQDFRKQNEVFMEQLGKKPIGIVWPYGKFTMPSIETAVKAGYVFTFTLEEGYASIDRPLSVNRSIIYNEPIEDFIKMIKDPYLEKPPIRAVQVDLDLVYDPDPVKMEENLGRLIDRLVAMKVNMVLLQAFADPDGTGDIRSVYFPNRVLPLRADILSHAIHQMYIREMYVYAWMPVIGMVLPDKERNTRLRVHEYVDGRIVPSTSWYNRLTPFSEEVKDIIKIIYEDLSTRTQAAGVLFQDDTYLTDYEDFHPEAVKVFKENFGYAADPAEATGDGPLSMEWARIKSERLIDVTSVAMDAFRRYLPTAKFARNLYAPVLMDEESKRWFAQDYEEYLKVYDFAVVMAYPQMEAAKDPAAWLSEMVAKVRSRGGLDKTVFKLQAYDWDEDDWIEDRRLLREMREILTSGGRHIAYYPDDYIINKPSLEVIKLEMSTRSYPFIQ